MKNNIVIFGASGLVGRHVVAALAPIAKNTGCQLVSPAREDCDFGGKSAMSPHAFIQTIDPRVVINCAGLSDVDLCQREPELSRNVNYIAVARMVDACKATGARLVHISTDFVKYGSLNAAVQNLNGGNAVPFYEMHKSMAEEAVETISRMAGGAVCIRTSWVYGNRREGQPVTFPVWFVDKALALYHRINNGETIPLNERLSLLQDRQSYPTNVADLAQAVALYALSDYVGTMNICNTPTKEQEYFTQADYGMLALQTYIEAFNRIKQPAGMKPAGMIDESIFGSRYKDIFEPVTQDDLLERGHWMIKRPVDTRLQAPIYTGMNMREIRPALLDYWSCVQSAAIFAQTQSAK